MTFVIVGYLVVASVVIARESIYNICHPHKIPEAWTLIVSGVVILWKEYSRDSPDQGVKGVETTVVLISKDSIKLDIPHIGADYKGCMKGGRIMGKFTQSGYVLDFRSFGPNHCRTSGGIACGGSG